MHRDIAVHCKHVQVHTIVSTFSAPCNIKALCVYVQLPNNKPCFITYKELIGIPI